MEVACTQVAAVGHMRKALLGVEAVVAYTQVAVAWEAR